MTIEELIMPRYKVIADYPNNNYYDVGEIINLVVKSNGEYWNGEASYYLTEKEIQKYPHIFRRLKWFEDRDEDIMPMYIKLIEAEGVAKVINYNVDSNTPCMVKVKALSVGTVNLYDYLPATEEEYNDYIYKTFASQI